MTDDPIRRAAERIAPCDGLSCRPEDAEHHHECPAFNRDDAERIIREEMGETMFHLIQSSADAKPASSAPGRRSTALVKCTRCGHYEADHSPSRPGCALCECADFDPADRHKELFGFSPSEDLAKGLERMKERSDPHPDDKALVRKHLGNVTDNLMRDALSLLAEQREQLTAHPEKGECCPCCKMVPELTIEKADLRERAEAAEADRQDCHFCDKEINFGYRAEAHRHMAAHRREWLDRIRELEADGRRLDERCKMLERLCDQTVTPEWILGWVWAEACAHTDAGGDVRNVTIPDVLDRLRAAIAAEEESE